MEGRGHLVVTLKAGEHLQIGEDVTLYLEPRSGKQTRVHVVAPKNRGVIRTKKYGPQGLTKAELLAQKGTDG